MKKENRINKIKKQLIASRNEIALLVKNAIDDQSEYLFTKEMKEINSLIDKFKTLEAHQQVIKLRVRSIYVQRN